MPEMMEANFWEISGNFLEGHYGAGESDLEAIK